MKLPERVWLDFLNPLETGEAHQLQWTSPAKEALVPTKETKAYTRYLLVVRKPSSIDKLWQLEKYEMEPRPPRDKHGVLKQFRRGHGASRLHLSAAGEARGEKTDLLAAVTGNVVLDMKVPKAHRAWPTLRISVCASTMSSTGHVEWCNRYEKRTAAALCKQMRHHLAHMIADESYPTSTQLATAFTVGMETVRELRQGAQHTAPLQLQYCSSS